MRTLQIEEIRTYVIIVGDRIVRREFPVAPGDHGGTATSAPARLGEGRAGIWRSEQSRGLKMEEGNGAEQGLCLYSGVKEGAWSPTCQWPTFVANQSAEPAYRESNIFVLEEPYRTGIIWHWRTIGRP